MKAFRWSIVLSFLTIVALARSLRRRSVADASQSTEPATHRLWMVNHYAVTGDIPGGTRHSELAAVLRKHGWQTDIFATSFNHNTHEFVRPVTLPRVVVSEPTRDAMFRWIPSSPYYRNDWKRYLNMVTFTMAFLVVAPFQRRPHIVLGSSAHLLAAFGAWLASRWHRVPFVLEIRDVWPDSLIQLGLSNKAVIAFLTKLEGFLYRRSALIVAVSEGIAARIADKGVSPDKITVVAHGLARTEDVPSLKDREQFRKRMGWEGRVVVIWAGSHQPFNGLDILIEAARELRDYQDLLFVFVGDGSEKPNLIRQANGLQNVRFHDPVAKSEIGLWLHAADIGALTARRFDAFTGVRPRKIFDYMGAALPIVCTVPGEAWTLIEDADAGVHAEWENPSALADAIRSLAAKPELRARMGRNGRCAVETVHSIEHSGELLHSVLERITR